MTGSWQRQCGALKNNLIAMVLVVVGLVALVWSLMPPTYSMDLSLIGEGKPAVVIVYDSGNLSSVQLVENMNPLRGKYDQHMHFLLADVNTPDGGAFQRANNVHDGSALFYSPRGEVLFLLESPRETNVLEDLVKKVFF